MKGKKGKHVIAPIVVILVALAIIGALFFVFQREPQYSPADLLKVNVDFGVLTSTKTGGAVVGSNGDYWNAGQQGYLTTTTGLSSGVRLNITNLGGLWTARAGLFGVNDSMMDSYSYVGIETTPYRSANITLTNLSAGIYDLYLYGFEENGAKGRYNVSTSVPQGTKQTGVNGNVYTSTSWEEGIQYVRYHDVYVNSEGKLVVQILSADGFVPVINGLQLVQTATSATMCTPVQIGWSSCNEGMRIAVYAPYHSSCPALSPLTQTCMSSALNIDFGIEPVTPAITKTGGAVIGSAGDYWNNGQQGYLKTTDGVLSTIRLNVTNLGGLWTAPSGLFAVNDPMMDTYSYVGSNTIPYPPGFVTLHNLSEGIYDLYLYGFEENGARGYYNVSVSTSSTTLHGAKQTGVNGSGYISAWREDAQYVVYRGLILNTTGAMVIQVLSADSGRPVMNGLQLVRTSSYTYATSACADSDGGLNYNVKGVVTKSTSSATDVCVGATQLYEFKCENNVTMSGSYPYDCPNGCSDGACISAPNTNTNSGNNRNRQRTITNSSAGSLSNTSSGTNTNTNNAGSSGGLPPSSSSQGSGVTGVSTTLANARDAVASWSLWVLIGVLVVAIIIVGIVIWYFARKPTNTPAYALN